MPVVAMRSMLISALRSAAGRMYSASPHFLAHLTGTAVILTYHRVVPRSELNTTFVQPGMYVTPETFGIHLRFLTSCFTMLSFDELLDKWQRGSWDDGARYCVLTFDDGWVDNYRYAYPMLRQLDVPATIFLPTSLIGSDEWLWSDRLAHVLQQQGRGGPDEWDSCIEQAKLLADDARTDLIARLAADAGVALPRQRRFVDWDEAREMSRHGISFGSHSSTHRNLTRLTGAPLERELREPLDVLRTERVNHVGVLAYPNGDHSAPIVSAARAAGYRAAVTTMPGVETSRPADRFRLRRIGVHDDVTRSAPLLALHVARQLRARTPSGEHLE
jgi:peptidoglycan/xylan/chitin deacetylase (PgdA/CDA1 family)